MSNDEYDIFMVEADKERQYREAVGRFLKNLSNRQDSVLAHVGTMAGSINFTFNQTLKWVGSDVRLATDLPFLSALKDPETGEIVIDEDNIDLVRQRPVDWSRQAELARYLVAEPMHQFPPLLLVITSAWAENPEDPMWVDGRATASTFEYEKFGEYEGIVKLSLDPSRYLIYALDGQHRVVGIRGALEMINSQFLQPKEKTGKAKGDKIPLEEWLGDERSRSDVDLVPAETIGIQLIPGVIRGETIEEARRRVTSVFVHVNQTAAPLKDGDLVLIDRNDGFASVAKDIATKHSFFRQNKRVNFSNNTISKRSTQVTTLSTLRTCTRLFLREDPDFDSWFTARGRGRVVAHRPPEKEIEVATRLLHEIWDRVTTLPGLHRLSTDPDATVPGMRNFRSEGGEAHLLYRPIGQQVVMQAVAMLLHRPGGHYTLDQIFNTLNQFDQAGGFCLDDPTKPWYGLLYNESQGKMVVSGQNLASRLLVYMIAGAPPAERDALCSEFALARRSREGHAWDLNGDEVALEEITLPNLL